MPMVRPLRFVAVSGFLIAAALSVTATSNLNLSKSNLYRLTSNADIVTVAQAQAMLAELDGLGPMDEATMKLWLTANSRRFGIRPERIKRTVFLPAGKVGKEAVIILLSNPADEAKALASTVKSSKSKSSD
jgi:hypothetical protein